MDCDSTWSQIYTSKKCRCIQSNCKFQRTLLGPTLRIGWQNTWYTGGDKKLLHGRKCRSQWINLCWKWLESKLRRRTGAIDNSVRGCNSILSGMLVATRFVDKLGFSIKCTAQLLRDIKAFITASTFSHLSVLSFCPTISPSISQQCASLPDHAQW